MNWLQSLFFNNNDEPMKISRIEIEGDFEFYQEDDTLKIRTVGSVEPPPAPETIEVRLRGDGSIMRFYKAPDSVDVINFEYWQDDPVMIEVKIIDSTWGFAPIQMMKKVNGNDRKVHTDWNKVGWDAEGCYFKLSDTVGDFDIPEPIGAEMITHVTVPYDDCWLILPDAEKRYNQKEAWPMTFNLYTDKETRES